MGERLVVFSAVADHPGGKYGPFDKDKVLPFNKVITKLGVAYDPPSGFFTAPVHGVYYFTFFYRSREESKSKLTMMKNGTLVVTTGNMSETGPADNAGSAAILELQKDDRVYVQMHANSCVWAADGATSFSGYLIREMFY